MWCCQRGGLARHWVPPLRPARSLPLIALHSASFSASLSAWFSAWFSASHSALHSACHSAFRCASFWVWGALLVAPAGLAAQELAGEAQRRDSLRSEATAYEHGEGVARDASRAAALYCEAARLGDAQAQFNLGWMLANGRGMPRDDRLAAFFFHAAAEQGMPHAQTMLQRVGAPAADTPPCMREPEPPVMPSAMPPVESPVVSAQAALAWPDVPAVIRTTAPKPLVELVKKIAADYRVHPQLALSIMEAESRFDPAALSPKNAQGLMQLIPQTSARFNVRKPFDPAQNIRGGVAYLRWLLAYFEGDVALVAAAYNAGEGTVDRYRGVPPYAETRAYVERVMKGVGIKAYPFDATAAGASPQLALIRAGRRAQ